MHCQHAYQKFVFYCCCCSACAKGDIQIRYYYYYYFLITIKRQRYKLWLQGGYAINHQGSGPGRHGSRRVCLPWLSYPLINRKHLRHQPPKCHHSCCHAELRKSDLEVTARHLNEVEAVQHVHLTNIPLWFGLLGDI